MCYVCVCSGTANNIIPGNATLRYEITLLSFERKSLMKVPLNNRAWLFQEIDINPKVK